MSLEAGCSPSIQMNGAREGRQGRRGGGGQIGPADAGGGEGLVGEYEAVDGAVVAVGAVHREGDGVGAGAEIHVAGLHPADEAQVGLAVVGDVHGAADDLGEGDGDGRCAVQRIAERGLSRVGAQPEGVGAGPGGVEAILGGSFFGAVEVGEKTAAGEQLLSDLAGIPGVGMDVGGDGLLALDPDQRGAGGEGQQARQGKNRQDAFLRHGGRG